MKRSLVTGLLVLMFGLSVFAASFSGMWSTDVVFTLGVGDVLTVADFTSILDVDYTVGDWVFGSNMFVDATQLFDLNFSINGVLGAFTFASFLDFDPTATEFSDWESVGTLSFAGVHLYAAFAIQRMATDVMGTGFAIGGYGNAGDVDIWIEADFNMYGMAGTLHDYGWGDATDWETYYDCTLAVPGWVSGKWGVQTDSCVATFSNLDIIIDAPLACLDLIVYVNFDCTKGFDYITFSLNDIDLGGGWFQLDDLDITFTPTSKTVTVDITPTFGSAVCVTPYFDIVHDYTTITAIDLDALLLKYVYNGVTIKAGERFPTAGNYYVGFTKSGSLTHYANCAVTGANEFVGIWFDGDSCCGGLTGASFVMFFDGVMGTADPSASTGIFDFILLSADVEVGIGSGFSLRAGLEVADTGLSNLSVGFTFSF